MAPKRKAAISKALKIQVWNKAFTENVGKAKCICCEITEITQMKFHCGHIISEAMGGETVLNNLVPICESCNKSMRVKNLNDFKDTLKDNAIEIADIVEKNNINIIKKNYYIVQSLYEIIKKYRLHYNIMYKVNTVDMYYKLKAHEFNALHSDVNNDLSDFSTIYTKLYYGPKINIRDIKTTKDSFEYFHYIKNVKEEEFINRMIDYYKKTNDNTLLGVNEKDIHPHIELIKQNIDIADHKKTTSFKKMLNII